MDYLAKFALQFWRSTSAKKYKEMIVEIHAEANKNYAGDFPLFIEFMQTQLPEFDFYQFRQSYYDVDPAARN